MISHRFRYLAHGARSACALVMLLAFVAPPAHADFLGSVQIDFRSGSQSGGFALNLPANLDHFDWSLASPLNIYSTADPGLLLATINGLTVGLEGDPGVSLGFSMSASGIPTHVTVTSSMVSFAPLSNPEAFATAAVTVTDDDGDGASVTGLFPGSMAYQAVYNGSSVFANLVLPVTAVPDSSNTGMGRFPLSLTTPIAGSVSSIQSQFDFILSANDSASGTSRFSVLVPEPSSLALAVVGIVPVLWRARRRFR